MDQQLRELREQVQQLQADNERLRAAGSPSSSNVAGAALEQAVDRFVYVPRERKCPRFSGKSSDLLWVDDWIEEARRSMEVRRMTSAEQALFLYDHLDGEAKAEIRFRSEVERKDPERIFVILKEVFSHSQSYVVLQQQFFQRRQLEDLLVRDQFVEHVRDGMLRRELKRSIRSNPDMSFLDIRSEAIRWVEEGDHAATPRARAYSCDTQVEVRGGCSQVGLGASAGELIALKETLQKQQKQLDLILEHLGSGVRARERLEVPSVSPQPHRFQADGRPICSRCDQPGHIARFCNGGPRPYSGRGRRGLALGSGVQGAAAVPEAQGN
ncbi:uncharacterized protein LOC143484854 [Brachyhypopomus gauderio]|uniref:uncharacterized protein LOC143484851 n=1 Tax=Brachyhypopomus gauderio TaxID=698409 RepID=UPI004041385B